MRLGLGVEGGRGTLAVAAFRGGRRLDLLGTVIGSSSVVNGRLRSEIDAPLLRPLSNGVLAVRAERLSDMTSDTPVANRAQPIREKLDLEPVVVFEISFQTVQRAMR